jgi:tetratricopeptide (TPR) repeat protein
MLPNLTLPLAVTLIVTIATSVSGQMSAPPTGKPIAPGLMKLNGDHQKRADQLDEEIEKATQADRWDEAIARAEELLALRSKDQGLKHFETVGADRRLRELRRVASMSKKDRAAFESSNTMNDQAVSLHAQGKFVAAQPLYEKALEIRRRLLGHDYPVTGTAYNNLAHNLYEHGKYAQAQLLYERALEIYRRLLTDDHPFIATSYNNLTYNLNAQGKYAAARQFHEKALEINRRLLTDDHPATAHSYNSLAVNLNAQGKYAAAQPLQEMALAIRRRLLTDDHRDTAQSYNNLGYTLFCQGKHAQAEPLYEKALEIFRRLLTDDHPATTASYNNMAANLSVQGKYAVAQPLYEKALQINRRLLTDDHPATARSYNNLAGVLQDEGKYAEAQPLHEKALAIRRRLLTDDHPATAESYHNLAGNFDVQGKYAQAEPLYEKGLAIRRRLLTDDHPDTAQSYNDLAWNLKAQGKFAAAQPLYEKALAIRVRLLSDVHLDTISSHNEMASNLNAQGKYIEAKDQWLRAVKGLDVARAEAAFTGLERAEGRGLLARPLLAAVLARLGQPAQAWQHLEADLGRGLLDELAARQDRRLAPGDRTRLGELTAALERLDNLLETTSKGTDEADRTKRFEDVKRQRDLASIALGQFQVKLVQEYGPLAGQAAPLDAIQAALPADTAMVTWVDLNPVGPNTADPDGEHWGVVVRSRGTPSWVPILGTGPSGLWTVDDTDLARRVKTKLQTRPGTGTADLRPLVDKLRAQRLKSLAKALDATADGLPPARRLIVLPSRSMTGIPVDALRGDDDSRTVSYAPSGTVFRYLREQSRPTRRAGLFAVGDPVFRRREGSTDPAPVPDHGLVLNLVAPGSNAANHGLKEGDVLLAYNGQSLTKEDDLKVVPDGAKPIAVEVWSDARSSRRELAPGKLGVILDPRPAAVALAERRLMRRLLVAARSGEEDFAPLPGTRREVETLVRLFESDDRPTKALLGHEANEPELERIAASGELANFGFIHVATHGVIDETIPQRSAVILTQTGLPDPLEQVMNHKPVFDGRLSVREI